jgi:hypothetical protein
MKTIGLITTGECEHRSLAGSLQRAFADHEVEFRTLRAIPFASITSGYVPYPARPSRAPTTFAEQLVHILAAEVNARRNACDLVFAIDDLELANIESPQNVTMLVRDAAERVATATGTHRAREQLRERCSFHLLCPMLEAYFYGEPAALTRAGAARPAVLASGRHLEAFFSADLQYIAPPDEVGHDWRTPDRAAHPKRYLRFLAEPGEYKETRGGCAALRELDWAQVFAYQPRGIAFARSLFDDIADALGVPCPFPGPTHPLTARKGDGVLRNL